MAMDRPPFLAFNRGEVSKHVLGRVDIEKMRLAAETQENFLPYVLGPMTIRPGMQYVGGTKNNLNCVLIPFVYANTDTALLEMTDGAMRVFNIVNGVETLVTRAAVSTSVTNGTFAATTGWTLAFTGTGGYSTITGNRLTLSSPVKGGLASATQTLAIAGADQNVRHALRIVVERGPVLFRIGSTSGGDEYVTETTLRTGVHSLAFTPTGASAYIQFETRSAPVKIIKSVAIESAGTMSVSTPWAGSNLSLIRHTQSGDIVFCVCKGVEPYQIERRSPYSWSVVKYQSVDGPFGVPNTSDITMTPSGLSGNITVTTNRNYFRPTHAGSLFRLFSYGQIVNENLGASGQYTKAIRISGVGTTRKFSVVVSGTWAGTVTLYRSLESENSGFAPVDNDAMSSGTKSSTSNWSNDYNDDKDNLICWFRLGVSSATFSGTANIVITYASGGAVGTFRITNFNSRTSVSAEVLIPIANTTSTDNWSEGDWSDYSGWPSAIAFHEGRLWFAGQDKIWGSVSDDYYSFNEDKVGDAGPINRTVGFGPIDTINWLLPLTRMVIGRQASETTVRSSSLDEPLTPTSFNLKDCSTQGSSAPQAARVDTRGVFIQQSRRRVYELFFDAEGLDYRARDLTRLNLDIGTQELTEIRVQRQPDTVLYFVRGDGEVACLLYERDDEVSAWFRIVTDGTVETCCVLPSLQEDIVYFVVKRTVNGQDVRYIERMAKRSQCSGLPGSRLADSHIIYSGSPTTTITGLSHLEGREVVVWGWNTTSPFTVTANDGTTQTVGRDLGTYTVSGGQITGLSSTVTDACVGLSYTAKFKSAKLAYAASLGTAMLQHKRVDQLGFSLLDTHYQGLQYGPSFDKMDNMPSVEGHEITPADTIWAQQEIQMTPIPGEWSTDSRICLQAEAPRPCTVAGVVFEITTHA